MSGALVIQHVQRMRRLWPVWLHSIS